MSSANLIVSLAVPKWQLRFHKKGGDGSGKCNIVPANDSVYFAIFEISTADKSRLDKIEGLNYGYEEKTIFIPQHGQCFTYVASESHIDERLTPYTWYKELVLMGIDYHQFPRPYAEGVRSVAHQVDGDIQRHENNMAIVASARNGA